MDGDTAKERQIVLLYITKKGDLCQADKKETSIYLSTYLTTYLSSEVSSVSAGHRNKGNASVTRNAFKN